MVIGAEHEHLLIGSRSWLEKKEREAGANMRNFNVHAAIAREIRNWMEANEAYTPVAIERAAHRQRTTPAYGEGAGGARMETETGMQLPVAWINHMEIGGAVLALYAESMEWYDRYMACAIGEHLPVGKHGARWRTADIAVVASAQNVSRNTIDISLSRARTFLRDRLCDKE